MPNVFTKGDFNLLSIRQSEV